ncbi:CubicO group peptidase (beta-lactamase class C family) [Mucilaginibacter yixingensis]|uniref:CubicO group peptidase (Beta-lactamase class C family) n=1 Tax=Mucilaginibacter yixingensis TaxID=1295612 RepID=A0A2T5J905_9SPHI|nr:serine hydrolase [Mucilaginibacter yixingensis]PTQ95879.1 CubicO group peptidase (beta-lactamase class C family) [Mucilaginibacter yixingensis]
MIRNKRVKLSVLVAGLMLQTACAQQTPHQINMRLVTDQARVQNTTYLLNNTSQMVPLLNLENARVASVHFMFPYAAPFDSLLNKYTRVDAFDDSDYNGIKNINNLSDDLKLYNTLVVAVTAADLNNTQVLEFLKHIKKIKKVVLVGFGNDVLTKLDGIDVPVIWSSEVTPVSAAFAAQAVFGGTAITQKMPKAVGPFAEGSGFITLQTRLQYAVPEAAGVNTEMLDEIDKVANEAVRVHATPGCVVLVAKDGKVIYNKAFGYHTYNNTQPDKITDIFDLASVTKVSATTMEVMRLYDQNKIGLDSTVGNYIALARTTSKNDIRIRELLTHQAGLVPDVSTYERLKPTDHSVDSSAAFPTKAGENYFIRKDFFKDVIWPSMLNSPLRTRGRYVYSDLSMYFMKEIVETISATPLNVYVQQNFYTPLGMQTAGFLPLQRFSKDRIIPTEQDDIFRHQLLIGYVHDQGAGVLGGVSGHAGLFASANDLAILYQMILNKGSYGGTQYFKPETVDLFTKQQSSVSRRGLGFDRWDPELSKHYPSELASPQTFGHTGYTGTCFWVDPKYNMVYIFLSNRVNPKETQKLTSLQIRGRIQDAAIRAIVKGN